MLLRPVVLHHVYPGLARGIFARSSAAAGQWTLDTCEKSLHLPLEHLWDQGMYYAVLAG